jgi:transcriptional regulator with XRE-family HTH domain
MPVMKISAALRSAAREAGLTDVDIAAKIGVHQTTVTKWLSGKGEPRGKHLIALVDAFPGFGERIGLKKATAAA